MEGTARALHVVGSVPRVHVAGKYCGRTSAISLWEAKKRAAEKGGDLVSANSMVNLIRLVSTLASSDSTKITDEKGGLKLTSPNFSWLFEGVSRAGLPASVLESSPGWVDAILLLGPFTEETTTLKTHEKTTILELPKQHLGKNGLLFLDAGNFLEERAGATETIRVNDSAEPIWLKERSGGCLYLDTKGMFTRSSEFSKRETDPIIPIFVHTMAERVSRLICGLTCTPSKGVGAPQSLIIRLATMDENVRMGAIFELP